jgi:hypothetical protein
MSFRTITTALALAAAATPAAFAAPGATWVGGEIGFQESPFRSQVSREQVRQDLMSFKANPVDAAGGRFVGGEQGYVPHQHTYVVREGMKVHTDGFAATMGMGPAAPYQPAKARPGSEYWEVTPY